MINSVELANFLSHNITKLDFNEGVTVFVGPNGSGKSSVIDGITFALFGQHTRKSNRSIIRRGENQAYSKVNFSINGSTFEATRKIDAKGNLTAQFIQEKQGKKSLLASGERKQFGESMTKTIESYIGLNFEKLKVASIVQQGELNSLIKAKPKEFKELINSIIGIDKLDIASEKMKTLQKKFHEHIQKKFGYDETSLNALRKELEVFQNEIKENEPIKKKLLDTREKNQTQLHKLEQQFEADLPKESKLKELETLKSHLVEYAKEAIKSLQKEITEKESKVKHCEDCFRLVELKDDIEKSQEKLKADLKQNADQIKELSVKLGILENHETLAEKLELKNGRCPVCNSKVEQLNPLFEIEHIRKEEQEIANKIKQLEGRNEKFLRKENEITAKFQKIIDAESTLRVHSIRTFDELTLVKSQIYEQKKQVSKISTLNSEKLIEIAEFDSHTKLLYEKIQKLEKETRYFNQDEFFQLKKILEEKRYEMSQLDQKIGAISEKLTTANAQIQKLSLIVEELEIASQYITQLDEIREKVFNRDGQVATSLRSWALQTISQKASEYLTMFNTKIQRIVLAEKIRDVSITCYSKNAFLELESLSGGEQVSIVLALRLGIAHLLGASNLNFVILDEPTTHLDEERRRSFVNVLSQLSNVYNINSNSPIQFIIITHDAEIFENSNVDRIYKFSATNEGTKIVAS